jgi:tRNA pseudouridine38-40 synthase
MVEAPLVVGAGRTDRGVHAYAQVIHVDLPDPLFPDDRGDPADRLRTSLNGQLGGAITVRRMLLVDPTFHARFSATERAYRYLVVLSESAPLTLISRIAWVVRGELDVDAMNEGASPAPRGPRFSLLLSSSAG